MRVLGLVQAAARPDDLWGSDPLVLSVYTSRKWLLEAHFRKCLVRQAFESMSRAFRAEYDLQTSCDTPGCKQRDVYIVYLQGLLREKDVSFKPFSEVIEY